MKKIIIIEDAQDVRTSLRDLLEQAGYQVFTAEDGKLGFELICVVKPDLVLCDIMMPKMSGYEVLEKVREANLDPFPLVFLTARTEIEDLRKGMNLGADDYLFKPYRAVELLKVVETRLSKYKTLKIVDEESKPIKTGSTNEPSDYILISKRNNSRFVHFSEIESIEAKGEYSQITLSAGERITIRKMMHEWEKILPEKSFLRIHRSTIVNLACIERVEKWFNRSNKVWMKNSNSTFIISQRYSVKLKDKIPVLK